MPDLLTHVLLVYVILTPLAFSANAVKKRYVPVAMVGAILPDLSKIRLVIDGRITELTGVPFSWVPVHRLGGTLVLVGIAALAFKNSERRAAVAYLLFGAMTQYPLDGLIKRANGLSPEYLYPFSWWQPPAGNLFLSSDPWPVVPAIIFSALTWYIYERD
jgi:hypothetical protein